MPRVVLEGSSMGAVACASCHGVNGEGGALGAFPRLADQSEGYLRKQLYDYRSGLRRNAIMQPVALGLTDAELFDAARWYAASRPPTTLWEGRVESATVARGARIARDGDWSRGVPACINCHGVAGAGVPPHFPALRGQSPIYIEAQLLV